MLITKNLKFEYSPQVNFCFPDMQCAAGGHMLIVGESGSGKTTLLHLLAGLLKPQNGSILIEDIDITNLSGGSMDKYRGEYISIIFQRMHFIGAVSVLDNVMMAQSLGVGKTDKTAAMQILEKLNIADQATKYINQLSLGQQQRVAIARALVNKPKLILADEPTSSLDAKNAKIVEQLLYDAAHEMNASLVIVTHDMRLKQSANNIIELT